MIEKNSYIGYLMLAALIVAMLFPYSYASDDTSVTLTPENEVPAADFIWAVNEKKVTFTDQSTDNSGSIVAWNWTFGDGNSSTEQNPVNFYESFGSYNVTLNVTDEYGSWNNTTKTIDVSSDTYPFKPMLILPVNNTQNAASDTHLKVKIYDPDGDQLDVTFYNKSGGVIGHFTGLSDDYAEMIWTDRELGGSYSWYTTVTDGSHTVTSDTWTFTVKEDEVKSDDTPLFYVGGLLFIGMAAIAEVSNYGGGGSKILYVLVALLAFVNVWIVWNVQWLVVFYIIVIIIYLLRWGLGSYLGGEPT
jgi:PKD repeat protein